MGSVSRKHKRDEIFLVVYTGERFGSKNTLNQSVQGGVSEKRKRRQLEIEDFRLVFEATKEVCPDNQHNVNKLRTAPLSNCLKKTGRTPALIC
jgi:hypothetical protein